MTKLEYAGDEQRMEQLFAEIARQKDIIKYLSKHHKLSPKDMIIAILVRDNWQIHNILEEAKVRGEFIETQVGGDLYQLMPALDLYKLVIALLNPRDPVNLFNLINSNYVGIQLDIQVMLEKRIVYKVPSEVKKQSIETLKVRKTTLEYLRQNGFKTVEDIIDKQLEIPSEYRGNIYAYLMFGIED